MTTYNLKYPTEQKIKERMDQLQDWMEAEYHLEQPTEVEELISTITKFNCLQEEDIDYIACSRYAIENKTKWNIPEEYKRINKIKK